MSSQAAKLRVVLADDESHIRILLKNLVTKMDAEVVGQAANGAEAVALFDEHRPDLVMLDINMPVKTGIEALKEIMQIDSSATVIMLTSVSDRASVAACVQAGAANYLRKDLRLAEMKALIEKTLGV